MSSIVSGVFKLTVGMLWKKATQHAAAQLKEGDLTDEDCRKIIIREMDDIKSKLDGLSRKDLLSSVSFLREGVSILEASLDSTTFLPVVDLKPEVTEGACGSRTATDVRSVAQQFTGIACSGEQFTAAKKRFETARERATIAFSNTALSLEERILAMKVRLTATIFESLRHPDVAALALQSLLKELNETAAVIEVFTVCLHGGIKSVFNQTKRRELAKSVLTVNTLVFDFTRKFTSIDVDYFNWPTIEVGKKHYMTIINLRIKDINNELYKWAVEELEHQVLPKPWRVPIYADAPFGVNSKGDILFRMLPLLVIGTLDSAGEISVHLYKFLENQVTNCCNKTVRAWEMAIESMAIDQDDNMYIVTSVVCEAAKHYSLWVMNSTGDMTEFLTSLEFLCEDYESVQVTITTNKKVVIAGQKFRTRIDVFVCDCNGSVEEVASTLEIPSPDKRRPLVFRLTSTDTAVLLAVVNTNTFFYVYDCSGSKVPKQAELPDPYVFVDIAFDFTNRHMIVLAKNQKDSTLTLLNFTHVDDLYPNTIYLGSSYIFKPSTSLFSHPNGILVLKHNDQLFRLK